MGGNEGSDAGTPLTDDGFPNSDFQAFEGLDGLDFPDSFPLPSEGAGEADLESNAGEDGENAADAPAAAGVKGKKKKKEKVPKEKKSKAEKKKKEKQPREPGEKTPLGLAGILCLVFGGLLLLGLLVSNVVIFLTDTKAIGVGVSSVLYYVIIMDVIGLIGIVSVPFLIFLHRKTVNVFTVGLGVSAMAMSLGAILLLTACFRYDFTIKAPQGAPSSDIPVSAPPAVLQEEM